MIGLKDLLTALRAVDRLLRLESKHGELIEAQAARIEELLARVQRLEAREAVLIAEAKGAASAAASAVAAQHVASLARDIGALDERTKHLERARGSPKALPSSDS